MKVFEKAIKKNIPILGICGGEQLINTVYGGSLIQDINKEVSTKIKHEQPNPRNQVSHSVSLKYGTKLYKIINKKNIKVNSAHHQSIKKPGNGLTVNAIAPDGIIEGIEDQSKDFCIGVQWHPEFLIERSDKILLKSFLEASKRNVKS